MGLLLMSACGSVTRAPVGGGLQAGTVELPTGASLTPVRELTARQQEMSQVVSGWLAAEEAFADAARTSDPYEPDLAATTLDPQLDGTRSFLERMSAHGLVAKGPVQYGAPHITELHGTKAMVRVCAMDAEIVVSSRTGRPVPGILGEVAFELFTSTMQLTDGGWKLISQDVGVGRCNHL